jgi:hypothetical protein
LAINYSLKINFLIKNNKAIISILPNIIKIIKDILVKLFISKNIKLSIPYILDATVFVSVNIDSLKEFSKLKVSKAKILDKINIAKINEIKTKKAILVSWSLNWESEWKRFRLKIFLGFTNL